MGWAKACRGRRTDETQKDCAQGVRKVADSRLFPEATVTADEKNRCLGIGPREAVSPTAPVTARRSRLDVRVDLGEGTMRRRQPLPCLHPTLIAALG